MYAKISMFMLLVATFCAQAQKADQVQAEQMVQLLSKLQQAGSIAAASQTSTPPSFSPAEVQQLMRVLGAAQQDPAAAAQLRMMLAAQLGAPSTDTAAVGAANVSRPGPKRQGVTRIAVLTPAVHFEGFTDPSASQMLSNEFLSVVTSYLQAPNVEIVPLKARVPVAAAAEAKALECDGELSLSMTRKSSASKASMFKHLAPGIAMIPGLGAIAGTAGMIATTATTVAVEAAASLSSSTQPKDTLTFEYTLTNVASGTPIVSNKASAIAKQAGEDLITPMVSSMANTIVSELMKESKH